MKGVFNQPYTDVGALQRDMEQMDDAQQRRFVRGLMVETHVSLHQHILADAEMQKKVDKIHEALFDPMDGLFYLRAWLCRIAKRAGIIFMATCGAFASIAAAGKSLGWW